MPTIKNPLDLRRTVGPTLAMGALLAFSVGAAFYLIAARSIENDTRARFAGHARGAQITIIARIKSYTDLLRGATSLFQTTDTLTRTAFHDYVRGLDLAHNFPGIETLNFAHPLLDADRDAWEREQRADLYRTAPEAPPFTIMPPGRRPSYLVLQFIEPTANSVLPLGFDISSNTKTVDTLAGLRDTGKLIASGVPIPYISVPGNAGLAVRMPIYRRGMPVGTMAERRAAYAGSVGLAFRVSNLVDGLLEDLSIRHVRMTLNDTTRKPGKGPPVLLYDSDLREGKRIMAPLAGDNFSAAVPIEYHGRTWTATFSIAKADLYTGFEDYLPWAAMLAGMLSASLLFALFHAQSSSRQRAVQLATGMTRELRDSQAKLEQTHENLRRLAAHADQIKEAERKRIAREIHDDLGQNLLALRIEADLLTNRTRARHPRLHARARNTLQQIDATIRSVRQIINDLRPNVLDLGLSAAVDWQTAEFTRRSGIPCTLIDELNDLPIDDHCATAFFRILQESLSNIVRHAHARAVRVELNTAHGCLRMGVSDDGVGLGDGVPRVGSFGLVGIEERIHILGGTCTITSTPDSGTLVYVSVPLSADTASRSRAAKSAPRRAALA
jgi:signal transduction histidine kinase